MQAGGRRFDPVQLHQKLVVPIGCRTALNGGLGNEARSALRAVVFFNNWEGKGSPGLDESRGGHRVEMYLARDL